MRENGSGGILSIPGSFWLPKGWFEGKERMEKGKEPQGKDTEKIGAVMVVGGGVGGMQAALDLANSGFKVYLVEESSAIGGRMAQLDKTFPTNDCSMCTLSPKLVEISRHLNIALLTDSEVTQVEGEAGNFRVTLKRK